MKFYRSLAVAIFPAIVFLLASCSGNEKKLIIINPANIARADELIVLKRSEIQKYIGTIAPGKYVTVSRDSLPIAAQYDDMDGDGDWDELAFLYSFMPNEKAKFDLSIADAPAAIKIATRAHVRLQKKNEKDKFGDPLSRDTMPAQNPSTDFSKTLLPLYLTEGPAWENDKLGFRLYFDTRNGRDIFGKLMPTMVMDTIGTDRSESYHQLSGWGMDILHVGNSLGAGSIAIATRGTDGVDTLIRVGGMIMKRETYELLTDGPIRAAFRIKYEWEINGQPVEIIDETSVWGGQYFYESKLYIKGTPKFAQAVVGFADFGNNVPGHINISESKIFYSYGPQSENKDNLGMAIAIDGSKYGWYGSITDSLSEIQNSYLVSQKFVPGEPVSYRFYSCWEKSNERFGTEAGFQDFLKEQAVLLHQKPVVDWE